MKMESTDDESTSKTNGKGHEDCHNHQQERSTDDADADADDDDDARLALQLRYRFQDHPLPFRALFAAGWKYKSPHYQAPNNGRIFETTGEMNAYFDRFALPDVISNLQSFARNGDDAAAASASAHTYSSQDDNKNEQDDKEGRMLRQAILDELYKLTTKRGDDDKSDDDVDESGDESDDAMRDGSNKKGSAQKQTPNEQPTKRRSVRLSQTNKNNSSSSRNESITTTEKGSNLYLHKKTASTSSRRKSLNNDNSSAKDLVLPTLKECIEFAQQQIHCNKNTYQPQETSYQQNDFGDWRFLLSTNHSLLIYGAGSKYELIKTFAEIELSREGYILMIDGFDDEVNSIETAILNLLVQLFLDDQEPDSQSAVPLDDGDCPVQGISNPYRSHPVVERAVAISRALAYRACETLIPIFLVIHNIEGAFRTAVDQEALAALVTNSKVSNGTASLRLVATTDHLDVMSLWDLPVAANFSWIWKQVHTGRPYVREFQMLAAEESKRKKTIKPNRRMEEQQEARVMEVLKTIAPRHGEALQVLARLQWEQMDKHSNKWVGYSPFWNECRKCLVVSKESQLLPLLNELKDHRLVTTKRENGSDFLNIPYSNEKIREILAYTREKN